MIVWAVSGPIFGFSDTWQLIINTGTTIITFLMVFLIQNTQNRDGAALQAKLDELIRASAAHNTFIGIEHLTEEELEEIRREIEERGQGQKAATSEARALRASRPTSRRGRPKRKPEERWRSTEGRRRRKSNVLHSDAH